MFLRQLRALRRAVHTYAPEDQAFYDDVVHRIARKDIRPVSIGRLIHTGEEALKNPAQLMLSAQFLHREIPVRLAKRLVDYGQLPFIVGCNPHFRQVFDMYLAAFKSLHEFPDIMSPDDEQRYTALLSELLSESKTCVISLLADGAKEALEVADSRVVNSFLDRTFRSRIGVRLLIDHQVQMRRAHPHFIGALCTQMLPRDVVSRCVTLVKHMAYNSPFRCAPDIDIIGDTATPFSYIPFHFEYIMTELLKNSVKATLLHNSKTHKRLVPPKVVVQIYVNDVDLCLRVSDQGGGIPPSVEAKMWAWSFSTTPTPQLNAADDELSGSALDMNLDTVSATARDSLSGYGVGLPMSRAYAEYFGGSLDLMSMHRHGTDAYLRLNQLTKTVFSMEEGLVGDVRTGKVAV